MAHSLMYNQGSLLTGTTCILARRHCGHPIAATFVACVAQLSGFPTPLGAVALRITDSLFKHHITGADRLHGSPMTTRKQEDLHACCAPDILLSATLFPIMNKIRT